ncbi:hypothetical protein [Pseudomonas veronii]|uniref:hypothetical protein n=1 Tax=Pseudomonas veronii TaxID=76761 RepID=UPI0021AD6C59|nr:hypothetical protein [Pseudomonas veronii]
MNAVVLAYSMLQGDEAGARQALHDFWYAVTQSVERHNPFEGDAQLRARLYAHVEARAIHRTVGCRN